MTRPRMTAIAPEMTAARITAPNRTGVETIATPQPGPGEVLIEVQRAGVCGTDLHILAGEYELARFPVTPGHEFSGVVAAVGEGVRRRRVGESVTADPNVPCLTCEECLRGAFNQCLDLQTVGVSRDGAFARYVLVPERAVWPTGDLTPAQAALVEPLACVMWGLKRLRVNPGDHALVYGAGPMGCLLLQALRASGAAGVAVVDIVESRLDTARNLGASRTFLADEHSALEAYRPQGFEVVVDATGVPKVLEGAVERTRAGGTVWVFGVARESDRIAISPYEFFRRDLTLLGSFAVNRTFSAAIALIRDGAIRVEPLISHVLPLSSFAEGMELARHSPDRMKVHFSLEAGA